MQFFPFSYSFNSVFFLFLFFFCFFLLFYFVCNPVGVCSNSHTSVSLISCIMGRKCAQAYWRLPDGSMCVCNSFVWAGPQRSERSAALALSKASSTEPKSQLSRFEVSGEILDKVKLMSSPPPFLFGEIYALSLHFHISFSADTILF